VTQALSAGNIDSHIDDSSGSLTVAEEDYSRARLLLAGQGLPKAAPGGYAILDQLPMGVSRAVEGERSAAAREAMTNAGRHAGVAEISVLARVGEDEASVFVRDRGAGFDPDAVAADRRGVRESIVGRMERAGGRATVVSAPGEGTEVELVLPRRRVVAR